MLSAYSEIAAALCITTCHHYSPTDNSFVVRYSVGRLEAAFAAFSTALATLLADKAAA